MKMEVREGNLALADWYYADLESTGSTGLLSRLRRNSRDPRIQGPLTLAQLQQLASSGRVDRHRTMVWRPQWTRWQPAGEVQKLFSHQSPPPLPNKVVHRGWVFGLIESIIYLSLSLVLSIPLAILSGVVRTFRFVATRLRLVFFPASALQESGPGMATGHPYPPSVSGNRNFPEAGFSQVNFAAGASETLKPLTAHQWAIFWSRFAILTQAFVCLMGVVLLFEFDEEPLAVFGIAWLFNYAVWICFMRNAWRCIPEKYQPTDDRTMLYWMLIPGLSTFGWLRLVPELGEAAYRVGNRTMNVPVLPGRIAKVATVMCFVPFLNLLGGIILLPWLLTVGRDLQQSRPEVTATLSGEFAS